MIVSATRTFIFIFCAAMFFTGTFAGAQPEPGGEDPLSKVIGGQIFFDADRTSFNKDLTRQILEGNVVAIGAGTMIAADYLSMDKNTNLVTASGHITVINRNVIFLGEDLTYHLTTGDMKLEKATMYSNNPEVVAEATSKILGFTQKEIAFEAERQLRLKEVRELKNRLREEARRQALKSGSVSEDLVEKYAVYLEQEQLIRTQENQSLASLSQEKRESFKRRRMFWDTSRKSGLVLPQSAATTAYFHIEGETLVRTNGNDYYARNSLFTPCYCKPDETPAWAFSASEIEAQVGGYADMYHPVLEIKGIPVLYLPYLKFPIKDRRQSGFLPPTFGFEDRSGNIYSQPVFLDLGSDSDATLKTDIYEKRGTRIGVEYRLQQRQFSGWEIEAESIRDRLWLSDRELRRDLRQLYTLGLDNALKATPDAPAEDPNFTERDYLEWSLMQKSYWDQIASTPRYGRTSVQNAAPAIRNDIENYLNVPENTWRGSYSWRGVTFLAPRLSFVSAGTINSDHRYAEELYVPDDFEDVIFGGRNEPAFARSKGQFHLDGQDFYLGLGTSFGDNYLSDERFEGQQLPLRVKLQSRYYSVFPEASPVPVYGMLSAEHYRISEYKSESEERNNTVSLGEGNWRRIKADFVSPWVTDSIVQVSQFTDFEGRYIEHGGLSSRTSEIRSWRTGLEFRLPIDGKGELPEFLQADPCTPEQAERGECVVDQYPGGRRHVHHIMDWRLKFSVRPSVVKVGPYTEGLEPGGNYAYFTGDKGGVAVDLDKEVPEEDRMREHRRISLATDHVWKLFNKDWRRIAAAADSKPAQKPDEETTKDAARRELLFSLEQPVTSESEIYNEETNQFLVDRYRLYEQYYLSPLNFHGDIAYDFLDAELREKQKKENAPAPLAEPWKEANLRLGMNYAGFSLATSALYNVYAKTAKKVGADLTFPAVFKTNLALGYTLEKVFQNEQVTRHRIRSYRLASTLIPMVSTYILASQRLEDGKQRSYTADYKTALGVRYDSDSRCWGLQFAREKDYGKQEGEASYLLKLSVIFMGEQRHFPNMSPGLEREIKDDNES